MAEVMVEPDELRSAATRIHDIATQVGLAFRGREPELDAPGQPGWSTTGTLGSAVAAWAPFVGTASDELRATAANLRAMADAFVEAECEATDRQRRAGNAFAA